MAQVAAPLVGGLARAWVRVPAVVTASAGQAMEAGLAEEPAAAGVSALEPEQVLGPAVGTDLKVAPVLDPELRAQGAVVELVAVGEAGLQAVQDWAAG